jgi:hypothetical protein
LQVETQDVVNKNTSHKNHKTKEIWPIAPTMKAYDKKLNENMSKIITISPSNKWIAS